MVNLNFQSTNTSKKNHLENQLNKGYSSNHKLRYMKSKKNNVKKSFPTIIKNQLLRPATYLQLY